MTTPSLLLDIGNEEGREREAYPDPLSPLGKACAAAGIRLPDYRTLKGWEKLDADPWTIGIGCTGLSITCGTVWTDAQIDGEVGRRVGRIEAELDAKIGWWRNLTPERQDVLVQMAYQMGVEGLLAFKRTLGFIRAGRYDLAAEGMLQSKWAAQTPKRARRMSDQMRTGVRAWAPRAAA